VSIVVNKIKKIVILLLLSFSLCACSLKPDVATLYKLEEPLQADIIIPASFSLDKPEEITISLTQNGKRVEDPDFVHIEIWKQDGSVAYEMEQAEEIGNGLYSIKKEFNQDGLYYVKAHASNDGSIIMPTKQFIVGELSANELDFLQDGVKNPEESHEHHH